MLSPNKSFFSRILLTLLPFIIAVALLYSVLISTSIIVTEDHVVSEYLLQERDRFETRYRETQGSAELPTTSYLRSYWQDDKNIPPGYLRLTNGLHEEGDSLHVVVSEVGGRRYYLVLNEWRLTSIDSHETLLRSVIAVVAGLVIIAGGIVAIVVARRISDPVTELAEDVASGWESGKQFRGSDRQDEVGLLSRTLNALVHRLDQNTEREKSFTRHASHEMRTPVAVIRNALSVMELDSCSEEKRQRNMARVKRACADIENLVDVFLCLGREEKTLEAASVNVSVLTDQLLKKYETLLASRNMSVSVEGGDASIQAVPALIELAMSNLLRNAINYGEGEISIVMNDKRMLISNAVADSVSTQKGYGYGLEIVRRIADYSDWSLSISEGSRFEVAIEFEAAS